MTYTKHGHHIPGTTYKDSLNVSVKVARCGGVRICRACQAEAKVVLAVADVAIFHDDNTVFKVYKGLEACGIKGVAAMDIVQAIQEEGILFRESAG